MTHPEKKISFAIDRGGTFTDVYATCNGRIYIEKLLSEDPSNYDDAPREGIKRILQRITSNPVLSTNIPSSEINWIRMGTTVATNALLERKGCPFCLVTTRGFGDLLQIGYQNRPDIFALNIIKPKMLYDAVLEVDERVRPLSANDSSDELDIRSGVNNVQVIVVQKPDSKKIENDLMKIYQNGIRGIAVVLMHGYFFQDHEKLIGDLAAKIGFEQISLSHEVIPSVKIVDRGDTTCVDAYLTPHIKNYINGFRRGFKNKLKDRTPLHFMQSDGGLVRADHFKGSSAILSGPAGGVVGYSRTTSEIIDGKPIIGFDMGGTSTDISRYNGEFELVHGTETSGTRIQTPQLNIRTVAAGGGSRLFYHNSMLTIGPESAGAHPGPVCYRKNGHLAITDANLFLGRLHPDFFPNIFGPGENEPLDRRSVKKAMLKLSADINKDGKKLGRQRLSPEEIALGFIDVANEVMVRPIREISVMRGYDIKEHILACFGGAAGQHACGVARRLGIRTIFIHQLSGLLSAVGMALADVVIDRQVPAGAVPLESECQNFLKRLDILERKCIAKLVDQGHEHEKITTSRYFNLRYQGTDTSFMIKEPVDHNFQKNFFIQHQREFGFNLKNGKILIDDIRVRATASVDKEILSFQQPEKKELPVCKTKCYFREGWLKTPIYEAKKLARSQQIKGPALIMQSGSTIVIEPDCYCDVVDNGIIINVDNPTREENSTTVDPVLLSIFNNRFMSIAEQMGRVLQKTAISTNIKERLDFSCAIFDEKGDLVANAPHVPVHLGSMSEAVRQQIQIQKSNIKPGDVLMSNHPVAGGSHLPDITVITPVWKDNKIRFYVASRGHHGDIGSASPGSMPPFSKTLDEEGLHIRSFKLIEQNVFKKEELVSLMTSITPPVRRPDLIIADLKAQVAANQRGIDLLDEMIQDHDEKTLFAYMKHIQINAENSVKKMLKKLAASLGTGKDILILKADDYLDDGSPIRLKLTIHAATGTATFDFTGTGFELWGNLNTPKAVTQAAILYTLRCLINQEIPLNQGCLNPITIILPKGSLLNPSPNAAVAGGNVLTSQRIVDVIFKAVKATAASQGCMNNFTFGNNMFGYYETIGGGSGAGPDWHGCSGVHTHMTNTRITDPEILEQRYPVLVREFSIRRGSGGAGQYHGGDGLIREIEFLEKMSAAILSERRVFKPYGLKGGKAGKSGQNLFISRDDHCISIGGKNEIDINPGDRIRILTPGGGGWGRQKKTFKDK